jgi:hypothetical protein
MRGATQSAGLKTSIYGLTKVAGEIEDVYLEMMGWKGAVSKPPSPSGDLQETNPSKRDLVA